MRRTFAGASPSPLPSDRKFGFFFAAAFLACALYALWVGAPARATACLGLAAFFAVAAFVKPQLLAPLNRLWFLLGVVLGRIVNPVVLGLVFFLVLTPVAVATRWFGRDALHLKRRPADSYWIDRDPVGPSPDSFKNQF
jgi:hypothetical protein